MSVTSSHDHAWQLPLPFDVVFTIVNDVLRQDAAVSNFHSLSATCYSLASLCRPMKFETVEINISPGNTALRPSPMQKFVALLNEVPDIVNYIKNLRIVDAHMPIDSLVWTSLGEEMDLCYILTRPYPKLKSLGLDLRTRWSRVPSRIKSAFQSCFALSTLQELTIGQNLVVPQAFFSFFKYVSKLKVQGSSCGRPFASRRTSFCTPNWLSFVDTSTDGSSTVYLFSEQTGICLSNLEHLSAYVRSAHVGSLKIPLRQCSSTLTDLEIYVSSSGGWRLAELDLQCLQVLKNLTLTTDVMPDGNAGRLSLSRFMWLCTTLRTCAEPNCIENVNIIISTRNYDLVKSLPWSYFDDVFGPSAKWPRLSKLSIQVNNENKEDVRRYKERSMEEMICPEMPALMRVDVLEIHISAEALEFWSL